jgi:hypothetical protein
MQQRTLVCVISQTREQEIVWDNFKKNVLDTLNADLALCIAVSDDYDYSNPYWQNAKYKWTCPEYKDWTDAFEFARQTDFPEATDDWKKILTIPSNWMSPINGYPGAGSILIFFRWLLWHNLKKEDIFKHYDRIIITRSDFMFLCPHPPMELLHPNYIWVPDGEHYGGITDRYAVLSEKNADGYFSIMKHIMTNTNNLYNTLKQLQDEIQDEINLEKSVMKVLEFEFGPNICRFFPYIMYSVRSKEGKTRWQSGYWVEELGYYIKYPSEFERAQFFQQIIVKPEDWYRIARQE